MQPELVLFSAASPASLHATTTKYGPYFEAHPEVASDIAHTLAVRRQHFPYRTFSIFDGNRLIPLSLMTGSPTRPLSITLVFTGQGSQWVGMGTALMENSDSFKQDIRDMDNVLKELRYPPPWSLSGQFKIFSKDRHQRLTIS